MIEDLSDAHRNHGEAELEGIQVVVHDEGVLYFLEGLDGDVFSLNDYRYTVSTATAPLFR
jgi:hypothetical protein